MKSIFKWLPVFCLSSCLLKSGEKVDLSDFDFGTTDSAELFFKNVRQSYYHLEERKQAKMNLFRLSNFSEGGRHPSIQPMIIHHWPIDEASIWLEFDSTFSSPITFTLFKDQVSSTVSFNGSSRQEHLKLANSIFEVLLDSGSVRCGGEELFAFGTADRLNYKVVMNDYYRLVGLK